MEKKILAKIASSRGDSPLEVERLLEKLRQNSGASTTTVTEFGATQLLNISEVRQSTPGCLTSIIIATLIEWSRQDKTLWNILL
jgi:hypothetical protein